MSLPKYYLMAMHISVATVPVRVIHFTKSVQLNG